MSLPTICPSCGESVFEKHGNGNVFCSSCLQLIVRGAANDGKSDGGKVRACFPIDYFPHAMEAIARVCEAGEKEYGYGTWKDVPDAGRRYNEALMRHRIEIAKGNVFDEKTGLRHSWHILWNAAAIVQLEFMGK